MTTALITAEQCQQAADLLVDREELLETLERMRGASLYRIEYGVIEAGSLDRFLRRGETQTTKITAAIRKLLQSEAEARVQEIDAQLRAIGVEPPPSARPEAAE